MFDAFVKAQVELLESGPRKRTGEGSDFAATKPVQRTPPWAPAGGAAVGALLGLLLAWLHARRRGESPPG